MYEKKKPNKSYQFEVAQLQRANVLLGWAKFNVAPKLLAQPVTELGSIL